MLPIEPGTKNGEILRGPPVRYASCVSSINGRPPMPEPMQTPMRSLSPAKSSRPASRLLRGKPARHVEILHLTRDSRRKRARIEACDRTDTAAARDDRRPRFEDADADR